MEQDEGIRFDEKNLWARQEGDEFVIGISQYLADQIGDITTIDLPDEGSAILRGDSFGSIEHSNGVVEDLVAPLNGEVLRLNEDLLETPEPVKDDPYGDGWLIAVDAEEGFDINTLMTYEQYEEYVETIEETDEDLDEFDDEDLDEVFTDDFDDDDDDF